MRSVARISAQESVIHIFLGERSRPLMRQFHPPFPIVWIVIPQCLISRQLVRQQTTTFDSLDDGIVLYLLTYNMYFNFISCHMSHVDCYLFVLINSRI